MLNSVTEHGYPPTTSPQPQPAPQQADTGSETPVEEPAQATMDKTVTFSLPLVTGYSEPYSEPSEPQSLPHSLASSEHESRHSPPAAEHKRLKLSSLASLFLIELWAGVASLSTAMSKLGAPLRAFCEADTLLHSLLTLTHPTLLSASQSEKGKWKLWDIPKSSVVWVFGGPSCTSLSTAGKQLAGRDPTSRYLFDHIAMAAACGASL